MAGIYIHIPFCKKACHYCDFHFSTSLKHQKEVIDAICDEIVMRRDFLKGQTVESVYFGGGTPSLLSAAEVHHIIDLIQNNFVVGKACEITLEANPDDLNLEKIRTLSKTAVNRLSIGVQSFFDGDLSDMNRSHNAEQAINSVKYSGDYFDNITIDLIYGIPDRSLKHWEQNMDIAFSLPIQHLSCYALTVEEKTALARFIQQKKCQPLDEQMALQHFNALKKRAPQHGFTAYEIANFGKKGFYSKHNTAYWQGKTYLGIGPAAHSFDGKNRSWNVANNIKYYKAIALNHRDYESERLSRNDRYNEYLMTALRTIWGVDFNKVKKEFGDLYHAYLQKESKRFIKDGLLAVTDNRLKHTDRGAFLIDGIIADLFYIAP